MSGVSNAVIKQAVVDAAIGIEAHSEMLAEKGLAHANEKAGDIIDRAGKHVRAGTKDVTGHVRGFWNEFVAKAKQAEAHYDAVDAKLDAIAAKLAHSRWTVLIFAAWTLLVFWLGTKL